MAFFKRTSLKDIADALGLSKTTVSFVLNGKANEYHISLQLACATAVLKYWAL